MTAKRIVLDANILIRAVLGVRVRELVERYGETVVFFTPEIAFEEAIKHLPTIALKREVDPRPLLESLTALGRIVEPVGEETTRPLRQAALERIGDRDPMDWPIVAAALALSCPIWTEDRDFFGVGIPTWTTARVELYLRDT